MPQHIYIKDSTGNQVAEMSTSHTANTSYDIRWCGNDGSTYSYPSTNTGIQRQPSESQARRQDFQNDRVHARRSIGAAYATAQQVLDELKPKSTEGAHLAGTILICLATNQFDRGEISIAPSGECCVDITLQIGTGPRRTPNATPTTVLEFTRKGVGVDAAGGPFAIALAVLASQGQWMLDVLKDTA